MFPRDPVKFKERADRECPAWPMELTAKAYNAWRALEKNPAFSEHHIVEFDEAHTNWLAKQPSR